MTRLLATKALVHIPGDSTTQMDMTKREKPPNVSCTSLHTRNVTGSPKRE